MTDRPARAATTAARTLSGAGLLASCVPMVAMLPGTVAGALAFVGLGASSAAVSALAPALNDIARPLLLVSAALLAVSGLRCGRTAVALGVGGGALLYLGMYVWTSADGTSAPALFYPGLACFFAAYAVTWRRRRAHDCRPVVSPPFANQLLVGTLVAGVAVVAVAAATAGPAAANRGGHQMGMPGQRPTSTGPSIPGMSK